MTKHTKKKSNPVRKRGFGVLGRNGQIGLLVERHLALVATLLILVTVWLAHSPWVARLSDPFAVLITVFWLGIVWAVIDWGCRIIGSESYMLGVRSARRNQRAEAKILDSL